MKNIVVDKVARNTPITGPRSKRQNSGSSVAATTTWKSNPTSSNTGVVSQPMHFPNRHYVVIYNLFLMIFNHNIGSDQEAQFWRYCFLYSMI